MSHQGASGWIARIIAIQDDPSTVARVSSLLPGKPEAYLLRSADKEALVQRISTRKQWRSTLVRIWVGEMERFLAMKAFTGDTDASKLSPSGAAAITSEHVGSPHFTQLDATYSCRSQHTRVESDALRAVHLLLST